jgi:hypothetical protein
MSLQTLLRAPPAAPKPDPWLEQIAVLVAQEEFLTTFSLTGKKYWFVVDRELKHALGASGVEGSRRIHAAMKKLGWGFRLARINGHRVRGFARVM